MAYLPLNEVRAELIERYESREKWQKFHDDLILDSLQHIDMLWQYKDRHIEIRAQRHTAFLVRHLLASSQLGLPADLYDNHLEWMVYFERIEPALEFVDRQIECAELVHEELVKMHEIWKKLWDLAESDSQPGSPDEDACAETLEKLHYHNQRRNFMQNKLEEGHPNVAALFEDEPKWL